MSNLNIVHTIIQRGGISDPNLRDSLIELAKEIDRLSIIVDPAPFVQIKAITVITPAPPPVLEFDYSLNPTNITLIWEPPTTGFLFYEIRRGSDWDTATRVTVTSNLSITIDPISVGTTRFLIRTLTSDGVYSNSATSLDIIIPEISITNLTAETIDSNVLLYWTVPISVFSIAYYIVERDGVEIARINATFFHFKELAGGIYIYSITPVDLAGNIGPEVELELEVDQPPNFILHETFESDFTLGVKVNTYLQPENGKLLVLVNLTETWQQHFDTRSWASPQAQVDAGYPIYIQPTPTTGSYKETFDVGIILSSIIVGVSWAYELITETFNIGVSVRVSDDGSSWTAAQIGQNTYWTSVRYIEVTMDFTGANDKALMDFYNFQVSVKVKEIMDGGFITADSTDTDGTVVTFNKAFKDITDITIAIISSTTVTAFIIFTDIPNPTSFKVKTYDNAGIRKTADIRWDARGAI